MASTHDLELESDPTAKYEWPQLVADGESAESSNSTQAHEHSELLLRNEAEGQHSAGEAACRQGRSDGGSRDFGKGPLP